MDILFFELIQVALGLRDSLCRNPTIQEWRKMYEMAARQSLIGVTFMAVERLPKDGRPDTDLILEWYGCAMQMTEMNRLMNIEAARLTKLFAVEGYRSAILKGQANARLYHFLTENSNSTEKLELLRQPGDIDIWVDCGRAKVIDLLMRTKLINESPVFSNNDNPQKPTISYHHVHLPANEDGVTVELHFRPSPGNYNPITNRRLQKYLTQVMDEKPTEEGFNIPSIQFTLIMQLAHIQRHFIGGGIGMRQIMDYYFLLKSQTNSTDKVCLTEKTGITEKTLRYLGLDKMAGAVMWVLGRVFSLDERLMICKPDARRGDWMLQDVMSGGNFGQYANSSDGLWRRFFKNRLRHLKMIRFNFWEGVWPELFYWKNFIKCIPLRIRYRTLSLNRFVSIQRNQEGYHRG